MPLTFWGYFLDVTNLVSEYEVELYLIKPHLCIFLFLMMKRATLMNERLCDA